MWFDCSRGLQEELIFSSINRNGGPLVRVRLPVSVSAQLLVLITSAIIANLYY